MLRVVLQRRSDAELALAAEIAALVRTRACERRPCVLGLAAGDSPRGVYRELCRLRREESLDLSGVTTFALDEFSGLRRDDPRCFGAFLRRELLDGVNVPLERAHVPRCDLESAEIPAHCADYERALAEAGGIDLQLLGIGRNGHIGFNEPGAALDSRTRAVALDRATLEDQAPAFGGVERVPPRAITMGVATILAARRIRVLAFGARKAPAVRAALEGPIGPAVPASFLREHADGVLLADEAALGL